MKILVVPLLVFFLSLNSQNNGYSPDSLVIEFIYEYLKAKYKNNVSDTYVVVRTETAVLLLASKNEIIASYPISYSYYGLGNKLNSFKTPTGLHTIHSKIGDGLPPGTKIVNGNPTNQIINKHCPKNPLDEIEITSRAIILDGLEYGINKGGNVDTYSRKIWIHGTPQYCWLGKKASHGCIRMDQDSIISFYNLVRRGMSVFIY